MRHRRQLYRQRADAENVFDELKNQWGFAGFCAQKAAVSQSSARMLLLVYNLWSLFVRVLKNQGGHTEVVRSRYELLLIPAKLVLSGCRKIIKLAVGSKFATFLKQAYQRLEKWLSRTAPQLSLPRLAARGHPMIPNPVVEIAMTHCAE